MINPLEKYLPFADEETPKSETGTWVLVAPSGRFFKGDSPIECIHLEIDSRVPPNVALGRIARAIKDYNDDTPQS